MEVQRPQQRDTYHHGDLYNALLARAAEVIEEHGIEALTLRGLARDLGVSHGAPNRHFKTRAHLLSALAEHGYGGLTHATLSAAEEVGDDPWIRLNAMGRGFLRWVFDNRASFRAICHPDVSRYADDALRAAIRRFRETIREAVAAAQRAGRHPDARLDILTLYTKAVPFGAAMMLFDGLFEEHRRNPAEREALIEELIELVVPIRDRVANGDRDDDGVRMAAGGSL